MNQTRVESSKQHQPENTTIQGWTQMKPKMINETEFITVKPDHKEKATRKTIDQGYTRQSQMISSWCQTEEVKWSSIEYAAILFVNKVKWPTAAQNQDSSVQLEFQKNQSNAKCCTHKQC